MQQFQRLNRFQMAFAVLAVAAATGCGGGNGSLSGRVTYEGEPVASGAVTITPADGKGSLSGGEITNGQFTVNEIPPGKKVINITAVKKVPFARSSEEMAQRAAEQQARGDDSGLIDPADIIPPDAQGNNVELEIKPGPQSHEFKLSKPTAK